MKDDKNSKLINLNELDSYDTESLLKNMSKERLIEITTELLNDPNDTFFEDHLKENVIEIITYSKKDIYVDQEDINKPIANDNEYSKILDERFSKLFIIDKIKHEGKKWWETFKFYDTNIDNFQSLQKKSDDFKKVYYSRQLLYYSTHKLKKLVDFIESQKLDLMSDSFWENPRNRNPVYEKIIAVIFYYTNYKEIPIRTVKEWKSEKLTWNGSRTGMIALMKKLEELKFIKGTNFYGKGNVKWHMIYNHFNFLFDDESDQAWTTCYSRTKEQKTINNKMDILSKNYIKKFDESNKPIFSKKTPLENLGLSDNYIKDDDTTTT